MPDIVIEGITYSSVPSVKFKDTDNVKKNFYFTGDANLSASEVVSGKIFYNSSGRQVGTGNRFNIDLTGTTWLINSTPSLPSTSQFYEVIFESIGDYQRLGLYSNEISYISDISEWASQAYVSGSGWIDPDYRTIYITGGSDTSNPSLVAWLLNNAEQQVPLTDLTGTTWTLNSSLVEGGLPDGDNIFNINYTFDGLTVNSQTPTITTFDVFLEHYGPTGTEYFYSDLSGTCSSIQGAQDYNVSPSEFVSTLSMMFDPKEGYLTDTVYIYTNYSMAPFYGWTFNNRTMSITGGTDATNTDLIAWLQANATQV